eukprot:7629100-Alexandrium_andersonii.AAC.1
MTPDAFRDSLQHVVESLRAKDRGELRNVMYGFGEAASAQLTVTREIYDKVPAALREAWQSLDVAHMDVLVDTMDFIWNAIR